FTTEQIQRAIAKAVGQDQLEWLSGRVHDWNARFFHEKIESIRIKYVKSKWGSCSSDRHLSFSSRLLLAPPPCIDYVIVHELAHLKELNHSARFWQWVARAMPAYKTWDKQLRHHGQKFDFELNLFIVHGSAVPTSAAHFHGSSCRKHSSQPLCTMREGLRF